MPEVDPAIAALALWCRHRDTPSAKTCTIGSVIHYGLDFDALFLPEQTGVVAHHVLHVALCHSARKVEMAQRSGADFAADLYILAADAIINEGLAAAGHALPRPAVLASELVTRVTGEPATDVLAEWDTDRLYRLLSDNSDARQKAEKYAGEQQFTSDLEGEVGQSEDAETWRVRMTQALAAGRGAGLGLGAHLHRFADLPSAQMPWEILLRRLLAKATDMQPRRSHARPAGRWIAADALARASGTAAPVFEPGPARNRLRPRIVVALDTSSSVRASQITLFAAEALGIARRSGAEAHVMGFDVVVHVEGPLRTGSDLQRLPMRSGGGTTFIPVIARAADYDPSVLVVMTDLDGPLGTKPCFPVIWVVPDAVPDPAFGQVIVMSP